MLNRSTSPAGHSRKLKRPLFLLLLLTGTVEAVVLEYSPFETNEAPQPFAVTKLIDLESSTRECRRFACQGETNPVLTIAWTTNGACWLLLKPDGVTTCSFRIEGNPVAQTDVYQVDLNEDTAADYMIHTWTAGCGLAAYMSFSTFVLSCPIGYIAYCILCYHAEPGDLLDINRDGKPEYLHTMFIDGEEGKDGKRHNYWVYNLLGFSGTNIVSANSADRRFPKWVWYRFKPNHADTDQLTGDQRTRLWMKDWEHRSHYWPGPLFPDPELFAPEQGGLKRATESGSTRPADSK